MRLALSVRKERGAMILAEAYDQLLRDLGREYFVSELRYVPDLQTWAKEEGHELHEPLQPVKIIPGNGSRLIMVIQKEISEEMLDSVIRSLGVRWSLRDNTDDVTRRLNSTKKRLVYCVLKECARTVSSLAGDDLLEDAWVLAKMEGFGYFRE